MEKQDDEEYEWEKQKEWGWVMDAGKKVVMAGVIISSAPVLLPPLLVVSALGFAVSLPSGVVLASYACTHKLMTKLLVTESREGGEMSSNSSSTDSKNILVEEEEEEEENQEREEEAEEGKENQEQEKEEEDGDEIEVLAVPGLVLRNEMYHVNKPAVNGRVNAHQTALLINRYFILAYNFLFSLVIDPKIDGDNLKEGNGVNGGGLHSRGEVISEDKIWEKIDAIRVIVGFKVPKRSSYVEEVKALYLFTGIEPPTQDQSHLAHLNFLMSVIGVK
ncbi:uncharacterized protein LOC121760977 [Salvia splendens]|uniref:uncharacterized protein LOC121760977 n=1 Tax=Salvia splendens TaxID=180675 RepID=UPI001C257919|nr:uncharacterized protein LOC121760977 [Salvia splendens]